MSEINNNNNINRFNKIDKIETYKNIEKKKPEPEETGVKEQPKYVQDTGVLGRSLVKDATKTDIARSVDDAVALALEHPDILESGEKIFTAIYDDCMKKGMGPLEAYYIGSEALKEFEEIGKAHKPQKK